MNMQTSTVRALIVLVLATMQGLPLPQVCHRGFDLFVASLSPT